MSTSTSACDLGVQRGDLGARHGQRGLGRLEGLARAGVGRQHLALAVSQLGLLERGDLGRAGGAAHSSAACLLRSSFCWVMSSISAAPAGPFWTRSPSVTFSDLSWPDTWAPTLTRSMASMVPLANTLSSRSARVTSADAKVGGGETTGMPHARRRPRPAGRRRSGRSARACCGAASSSYCRLPGTEGVPRRERRAHAVRGADDAWALRFIDQVSLCPHILNTSSIKQPAMCLKG